MERAKKTRGGIRAPLKRFYSCDDIIRYPGQGTGHSMEAKARSVIAYLKSTIRSVAKAGLQKCAWRERIGANALEVQQVGRKVI